MCEDCLEFKKARDEALDALTLEDGKASEIFSEYWNNKAMVKHLRKERDDLLELVKNLRTELAARHNET